MKKRFFTALLLSALATVAFVGCGDKDKGEKGSASSDTSTTDSAAKEEKTLNEQLADATGTVVFGVDGEAEIETTMDTGGTFLGADGVQEIEIDGGETGAKLKATGMGVGAIKARGDGTLVLKNLTVTDESNSYTQVTGWRDGYLEFGGKLRFENCTFDCSIYLRDDAEAEFVNCRFISGASRFYSVWMSDGGAEFTDCTFTGYRGLKIHEEGSDVKTVALNGCRFDGLFEKVGIAIGNISVDAENTTVSIKSCEFTDCQPWDNVGSLEGIDGFYEADTDTDTFGFVCEETLVDGIECEYLEKEVNIRYGK